MYTVLLIDDWNGIAEKVHTKFVPLIKEQMLKEFLTNHSYGMNEWIMLADLLQFREVHRNVRLIVFQLTGEVRHDWLFILNNIARDYLQQECDLILSTTLGNRLVVLLENISTESIKRSLAYVKWFVQQYYQFEYDVLITDAEDIKNIRKLYKATISDLSRPALIDAKVLDEQSVAKEHVVDEMIHYIRSHLCDSSLSLSKLAKEIFFMNADYLGKLFKQKTGEKFSNYVMRLRMEKAVQIISTYQNMKIIDIAAKVGYGDASHYFSQVFRRWTGYTPTQFRNHEPVKHIK